jgi:Flp pilus assembly protein TadD
MISPATHLAYAAGYLQLGMLAESRAELENLTPEVLATPAALSLKLELAMAEEDWLEVLGRALELVAYDNTEERPWIAWAYALRELQRIEEARETLLTGARLIKKPSLLVAYNLACYACLLGDLPDARRLLATVYARDESWRDIAREDDDLAALRTSSP